MEQVSGRATLGQGCLTWQDREILNREGGTQVMTWMEWWGWVRVGTPGQTAGKAEDSDVAFTSQLKVDRVAETLEAAGARTNWAGRGSCQLPFGAQNRGTASGTRLQSGGCCLSRQKQTPLFTPADIQPGTPQMVL